MNPTRLHVLAVSLLVAACRSGGDSPPPRRTVTSTFTGVVDAGAGTVTIRADGPAAAPGGALASLVEIPVVQDGVPDQGPPDTAELVTVGTASVPLGCGAVDGFEGAIRLRSFHAGAVLTNAHVEITSLTPTGREACNSAAPPFPEVSDALGLWDYGTLGRAGAGFDAAQRTWRFRVPDQTRFVFRGRVVADLVTADPNPPTTIAVPGAGTYVAGTVELACSDAETGCAATYYTTDGTEPTAASPVYAGPIPLAGSLTLRWFSVDFWGNAEAVRSAAYVVDTTPPSVVSVTPAHESVAVPATTAVAVTFSEPVDPATVTSATFTLTGPAGTASGAIAASAGNTVFTFTPAAPLQAEARYAVAVTAVRDVAGNALAPAFESAFYTPTARRTAELATSARILNHQLVYDWYGNGLAAWSAATQGGVAIVYSTYTASSASWSAARVLATERGQSSPSPVRVATDGSQFLVAWCTTSRVRAVLVQDGVPGTIADLTTGGASLVASDLAASARGANRFLVARSFQWNVSGWSWGGSAWSAETTIGAAEGDARPVLAGNTVYYLGGGDVMASSYGTLWSAPVAVATTTVAEGAPVSLSVAVGTSTILAFGTDRGHVWAATGSGTSFGSKWDVSGVSSEATAPLAIAAGAYGSEVAVAWVTAGGVVRGAVRNGGVWPTTPATLVGSRGAEISLAGFSSGFLAAITAYDAGSSVASAWAVPTGGAAGSRTWASPIELESGAAVAAEPGALASGTGAMIHWTQADASAGHQVMIRPYGAGLGATQTPFVPPAVAGSPAGVRLAANRAGDVLAVWNQDDGGGATVFGALHTAAGWSAPVRVVTRAWAHAPPDVASNGTDFLVVAAAASPTTPSTRAMVSVPVVGGAIGEAQVVATGVIDAPRVASDGQGYAAMWVRGGSIEGAIRSGGTWLETQALGSGVYPSLAGRAGEYLFVWQELGSTSPYVGQRRAAGAGASWTWEQRSWLGTYPYDAEVAAGPAGFFVAVRASSGIIEGWTVVGGATGSTVRLGSGRTPCERLRVAASGGRYLVAWNCSDWLRTAETDGTVALPAVDHAMSIYTPGYRETALGFGIAGAGAGRFRLVYSLLTSQYYPNHVRGRDSVAGSWGLVRLLDEGNRSTQSAVGVQWDGGAYLAVWAQTTAASPIVDDLVTYWAF